MKKGDGRRKFARGYVRRKLDDWFVSWDEEPLNDRDELRTAYVAYDARLTETLTGTAATLVGFAALGIATMALTDARPWQASALGIVAGIAMLVGLFGCWVAAMTAAAQAVTQHRQAVRLATLSAPLDAAQKPQRATRTAVRVGAAVAFTSGVLFTVAARRRRR